MLRWCFFRLYSSVFIYCVMSVYQQGAFLIKGLREFTKNAYLKAAKSFKEADLDKDLKGLVYIVTGANSGLGKAVATELAKKGGEVHMVCRSEDRGKKALDEIVELTKNSNVHLHILDMSQTGEVFKFANSFSEEHQSLNGLINNSGCMVLERTFTKDNVEVNFATNTLGTYVLTEQLLPLMTQSQSPRVITVSSGGMYTQKLNADDMQCKTGSFVGRIVYAQNKRQQVVLNEEWSKQHPKVHFSCMHPGWADTPAVQTSMPDFHAKMINKLRTPEQGADTIVWLAVSDAAVQQPSGSFFLDRQVANTHLMFAWTRESNEERQKFLTNLAELASSLKPN